MLVLIDYGATHNFISIAVVEGLKLQRYPTRYDIVMGTGNEVNSQGICRNIMLKLPETSIQADFLPLEQGNLDVILGMQWLQTMGTMKVD